MAGGGGGKGGQSESSSTVKLPENIEKIAEENLALADRIGEIGYVPYQGNTVAAFTPQQQAVMQNTSDAASAFGMGNGSSQAAAAGVDPFTGMAMDPNMSGGVLGYSPYAAYQDAQSQIAPGQRAAIDSFFIDPQTGAAAGGGNANAAAQTAGGGKGGYRDNTNGRQGHGTDLFKNQLGSK
jgi:hypothetical protein